MAEDYDPETHFREGYAAAARDDDAEFQRLDAQIAGLNELVAELVSALEQTVRFLDALLTVADELSPHVSARAIQEHADAARAALAKAAGEAA